MHLNQVLPDAVSLFHDDIEWVQLIDYKHVPFRCRKCHDLGHLFRDCPLNQKPSSQTSSDKPTPDGFTKVASRRRNHKKSATNPKMHLASSSKPSTSNSFAALASADDPDSESPSLPEKETNNDKHESQKDPLSLPEDPLINKNLSHT